MTFTCPCCKELMEAITLFDIPVDFRHKEEKLKEEKEELFKIIQDLSKEIKEIKKILSYNIPSFTKDEVFNMSLEEFIVKEKDIDLAMKLNRIK